FYLSTPRGDMAAREVILASGGYTTGATPALRKKIIPIGSYIIVTEVLEEGMARELSPKNRMIYDSKHFLYYYRLTPDRRMLFGGRAAFFPENETTVRESAEILQRGMIHVYPQLSKVNVEFVWGGTLDFAFDVMPHTGQSDGMHYAVGYAGHGVAIGTYLGSKIAGVICGDPNDIPFDGIPFPTPPPGLRSGHTWALPLAGADLPHHQIRGWAEQDRHGSPVQCKTVTADQGHTCHYHRSTHHVHQPHPTPGNVKWPGQIRLGLSEFLRCKHGHQGCRNPQPGINGDQLGQRFERKQGVAARRDQNGNPRGSVPWMYFREQWRQIAVFGHGKWHPGAGKHGCVQQGDVRHHRSDRHPKSKPSTPDQQCCLGKITRVPLLPISQRCHRKQRGQEVSSDRQRHDQRQAEWVISLRILDLFRHR